MAQTKKKTATKTKKTPAKRTGSKVNTRTAKKQQKGISDEERMHVYIVTIMAMIAGILLCANAAMMMA